MLSVGRICQENLSHPFKKMLVCQENSKAVVETNREEFLEHPVAVLVVAGAVVVEARMEEEFRGNVLVELKRKSVNN